MDGPDNPESTVNVPCDDLIFMLAISGSSHRVKTGTELTAEYMCGADVTDPTQKENQSRSSCSLQLTLEFVF